MKQYMLQYANKIKWYMLRYKNKRKFYKKKINKHLLLTRQQKIESIWENFETAVEINNCNNRVPSEEEHLDSLKQQVNRLQQTITPPNQITYIKLWMRGTHKCNRIWKL